MKNKIKLFIVIGIIFVIAMFFVVREYIFFGSSDNTITTRRMNTKVTLKRLSTLICTMFLEEYKNPVDMNMIIDFAIKIEDVPLIAKIDDSKIYDEWSNPILLIIKDSPKMVKYTFISCGPNQQDEHGKGDDITDSYEFIKEH